MREIHDPAAAGVPAREQDNSTLGRDTNVAPTLLI